MRPAEKLLAACLNLYASDDSDAVADIFDELPDLNEQYKDLYLLAAEQKLLPVVYDAVSGLRSFARTDKYIRDTYRAGSIAAVAVQTRRTRRFLELYERLAGAGVNCAVLKGVICRSLYAKPDLRGSTDEDVITDEASLEKYTELLVGEGLVRDGDDFIDRETGLRIETHTRLFETEPAFAPLFPSILSNTVDFTTAEGVTVRTAEPCSNLVFLILHSALHFKAGGFGVRTLCDIVKFAERFGDSIDEDRLASALMTTGTFDFARAVFEAGRRYLGVDCRFFKAPGSPDPEMLFDDLLSGGLFGKNTIEREHSAAITSQNTRSSMLRRMWGALFPTYTVMAVKKPYLRKMPWLLPFAWLFRIMNYIFVHHGKSGGALESVRIGKGRLGLLDMYGLSAQTATASPDTAASSYTVIASDAGRLLARINAVLDAGAPFPLRVTGNSMAPFLRSGRDTVNLVTPEFPLKRGSIALYRRDGGQLVLHRVIKRRGSVYTFIGDAQLEREEGIAESAIIATASSVVRAGEFIGADSFTFRKYAAARVFIRMYNQARTKTRAAK